MKKWWSSHINPASHLLSLHSADDVTDDVTMTRQLWCDHMNSDIQLAGLVKNGKYSLEYLHFAKLFMQKQLLKRTKISRTIPVLQNVK